MRKFIVLHSAEDFNRNKPIIVYIDGIAYMTPRLEGDNEEGTIIQLANWNIPVMECMGDVLKKIKEQKQTESEDE